MYLLRLENFSISVGMAPLKADPTRMSFFKSAHKPISVGMVPLIPVNRNQSSWSPRRYPILVGMVPVIKLPSRVKNSTIIVERMLH